jgi:hypothetical protein
VPVAIEPTLVRLVTATAEVDCVVVPLPS